MGREFAGRNAKGQRVFGLVSGSALATHVLADESTLWQVPDEWTLEQASTIPVAYVLVSFIRRFLKIMKTERRPRLTVHTNCRVLSFAGLLRVVRARQNPSERIGIPQRRNELHGFSRSERLAKQRRDGVRFGGKRIAKAISPRELSESASPKVRLARVNVKYTTEIRAVSGARWKRRER